MYLNKFNLFFTIFRVQKNAHILGMWFDLAHSGHDSYVNWRKEWASGMPLTLSCMETFACHAPGETSSQSVMCTDMCWLPLPSVSCSRLLRCTTY